VYFTYDSSALSSESLALLQKDAAILQTMFRNSSDATAVIEGHCEERGSEEYSLGLAAHRAARVKEFLVALGLPSERLYTISFGKDRPQCAGSDEGCARPNRRVHFEVRR
jgi:peptidoglycan-associated lipoprotein